MTARGPLAGLRVLDLGLSWAGPFAGMIMADLGADVIKVESGKKLDILRWSGAFADGVRTPERSGYYAACNRGKRSVTLNFKEERAREMLLDLVEISDVVIENFAPRVLPGLGLGYEQLSARNENLVMVSMSGYGASGPQREYVSYGDHLLQASGFASQTGGPDDLPTMLGTFYGDPVAGMYASLGILAALADRDRGAGGRWLDLSQIEGLVALLPSEFVRASAGHPAPKSVDGSESFAPHGYFRCLGDDAWVALSVRSDSEWRDLREIIAAAGIAVGDYATLAERTAGEEQIHAAVSEWTSTRSPWEITAACQAKGIAAYPMLDSPALMRSTQLASREFFQWVDRPLTGPSVLPGVTLKMAKGRSTVRGYAPLLGEHNHEVFGGLLGIPDDEIDRLIAADVIA